MLPGRLTSTSAISLFLPSSSPEDQFGKLSGAMKQDSNLGRLGDKREHYLGAKSSPLGNLVMNEIFKINFLSL